MSTKLSYAVACVAMLLASNPAFAEGEPVAATRLPADANMIQQHLDAAMIHSAYIDGDFDSARRRAERLSERKTPSLSAALVPRFERMKRAAGDVVKADTRTEMARSIANMAASCRDCHQTANVRPPWQRIVSERAERERGHVVASNLMWHALIFSDSETWQKGTELLGDDLSMVQDQASPTLQLLQQQVTEIAGQGSAKPISWARHYSAFLESCIACHALTELPLR